MGAKTALLALADGDIRPVLATGARSTQAEAEELVRRVFPGYSTESIGEGSLFEHEYPPDDIAYATALPGVELLSDRRLARDLPSELPVHLRKLGAGRRIIMHGMHSVVDWLGFAVWEDGELVRSLSLSPDDGIVENIGQPYDFELPYWAGDHPVEPIPGWPNQRPYPLPFHPLELGELALRALFGFVIEGYPDPNDIDTGSVPLHGFRVTDPAGHEQAAREAARARTLAMMGPPRMFRMGPDGTMQETTLDNP
ncbi:DUF6928 family protein [Kutzneria chonburiensis]|uniref:DUF6928 family protein n=1 Tax=Kutzneria chonburiensis TaxID=1483604 RepID=A0ABV6MTY7_9PSEU|nr:hypothetical protein [Kutzneria chonburiensis]